MVRLVKIGDALMKNILLGAVIFIVGIACGLIFTYGTLHAEESTGNAEVIAKLDEISKGQADLTAAINSIKEDLQIIKIRVTQSQ
jgi:hypothetical protein